MKAEWLMLWWNLIFIVPFGLALLYLGGESAQMSMNLPQAITQLFQGMMLFFLLASDVLILYRPRLNLRWSRRAPATAVHAGAL